MVDHPYRIDVTRTAEKDLKQLPKSDRDRVLSVIEALADHPRPRGCDKLTDREEYRIRVGDFRVTYAIDDTQRAVTIYRARHRSDVYR